MQATRNGLRRDTNAIRRYAVVALSSADFTRIYHHHVADRIYPSDIYVRDIGLKLIRNPRENVDLFPRDIRR